jgi:hypothetical protein
MRRRLALLIAAGALTATLGACEWPKGDEWQYPTFPLIKNCEHYTGHASNSGCSW